MKIQQIKTSIGTTISVPRFPSAKDVWKPLRASWQGSIVKPGGD